MVAGPAGVGFQDSRDATVTARGFFQQRVAAMLAFQSFRSQGQNQQEAIEAREARHKGRGCRGCRVCTLGSWEEGLFCVAGRRVRNDAHEHLC